jgi:hypothetical protein
MCYESAKGQGKLFVAKLFKEVTWKPQISTQYISLI